MRKEQFTRLITYTSSMADQPLHSLMLGKQPDVITGHPNDAVLPGYHRLGSRKWDPLHRYILQWGDCEETALVDIRKHFFVDTQTLIVTSWLLADGYTPDAFRNVWQVNGRTWMGQVTPADKFITGPWMSLGLTAAIA